MKTPLYTGEWYLEYSNDKSLNIQTNKYSVSDRPSIDFLK